MKKLAIFYTIFLAVRLSALLAFRCCDSARISRIGSVAVGKFIFKISWVLQNTPLSCQGYPLWSL